LPHSRTSGKNSTPIVSSSVIASPGRPAREEFTISPKPWHKCKLLEVPLCLRLVMVILLSRSCIPALGILLQLSCSLLLGHNLLLLSFGNVQFCSQCHPSNLSCTELLCKIIGFLGIGQFNQYPVQCNLGLRSTGLQFLPLFLACLDLLVPSEYLLILSLEVLPQLLHLGLQPFQPRDFILKASYSGLHLGYFR
jgi:hypothetical protein